MIGTHDTQASSDQSGATLRALLANPPQESSDVGATLDVAEIADSEAEAYANARASTSPPLLDVEVSTNVGTSTSLAIEQTTRTTPGISVGHASAPVASSSRATPVMSHTSPMWH